MIIYFYIIALLLIYKKWKIGILNWNFYYQKEVKNMDDKKNGKVIKNIIQVLLSRAYILKRGVCNVW